MSKKKVAKQLGLTAAVAASAVVAANPASAASASQVETAVVQAEKDAIALGKFYRNANLEVSAEFSVAYEKAKKSIASAKAQVATLTGSQKSLLSARVAAADANRLKAAYYIDAVKFVKGDLADATAALAEHVEAGKITDETVEVYNNLSATIRKAERVIGKVYGSEVREALQSSYLLDAKFAREAVIYEVSQYELMKKIDAQVAAGELEKAEANFAVLERLKTRAVEIKEAGRALYPDRTDVYPDLPAIEKQLRSAETTVFASYEEKLAPAVKSVSAINATQVQVTFNKAVDAKSLFTNGVSGTFKQDVISIRSLDSVTDGTLSGELSADGKVLTVTSTQLFEKRYDVVVDKVTTTEGKNVEKFSQIISIDKDVTAPTILGTEVVTANQVKIKFSEPMASAGSTTFKLADGTVVTDITGQGTLVDGGKAVILDLSDVDVPVSKDITATIIGAADKAGNLLTPNPATVTFQKGAKDGVAPTVSSVTQTGAKTFEIKFSEAIVVKPTVAIDSQAVTAADVVIDSKDATKVTVTAGSVLDGDKIVTISNFVDGSGETGATTNRVVKFVKDAVAPKLVSTAVVADATDKAEYLEFTFDKNVVLTNATVDVTSGSYVKDHVTTSIVDNDITATSIDYKDAANNKKVVRVKLDTLLSTSDVEGANYSVNVTFANVESEAGVAYTTGKATFTRGKDGTLANTDVIALAANNAIVQGNTNDEVVVTFDKNVDAATATDTGNYIVGGAVVESATVNSTNLKQVTLKLKANSNTFSGSRNVTVQNVKASGSTVAMTTVTKAVDLNENVVPTVTAQLQSDLKTVKLTFSENVFQVANNTLDFGVLVGTEALTYDHDNDALTPEVAFEVDSALDTSAANAVNTINVTLPSTVTATQLNKGLSLKALDSIDITDAKGNKLSVSGNITISQ